MPSKTAPTASECRLSPPVEQRVNWPDPPPSRAATFGWVCGTAKNLRRVLQLFLNFDMIRVVASAARLEFEAVDSSNRILTRVCFPASDGYTFIAGTSSSIVLMLRQKQFYTHINRLANFRNGQQVALYGWEDDERVPQVRISSCAPDNTASTVRLMTLDVVMTTPALPTWTYFRRRVSSSTFSSSVTSALHVAGARVNLHTAYQQFGIRLNLPPDEVVVAAASFQCPRCIVTLPAEENDDDDVNNCCEQFVGSIPAISLPADMWWWVKRIPPLSEHVTLMIPQREDINPFLLVEFDVGDMGVASIFMVGCVIDETDDSADIVRNHDEHVASGEHRVRMQTTSPTDVTVARDVVSCDEGRDYDDDDDNDDDDDDGAAKSCDADSSSSDTSTDAADAWDSNDIAPAPVDTDPMDDSDDETNGLRRSTRLAPRAAKRGRR